MLWLYKIVTTLERRTILKTVAAIFYLPRS